MPGRTCLVAVAVLLAVATIATAAPAAPAPGVLDLVPEDAAFGLAIRDISDLKKKGDKLYVDAGLKEGELPRFSTLFGELFGLVGIKAGVDENAPAAVIVANPRAAGLTRVPIDLDILKLLVAAVPFTDLDKMAGNFNLKAADLKDGKVVGARGRGIFLRVHGRHLLLAADEKVAEKVFKGKTLAAVLPEAQRKSLAGSDILFHVGPEWLGDSWGDFLKEMRDKLSEDAGEANRKVIGDLVEALKAIRFGLGAIRIKDGIGVSLVAVLKDTVPEAARQALASLAGGTGACDLKGLPDGPVVLANAARGDGMQSARTMKVFADLALHEFVEAKWLLSATDHASVVTALTEVWKQLKGHRLAVYRNADPTRHGLFSAVAILDTTDGERFLADMKRLARLAGTEGLDLSDRGQKEDVAAVEKLVRDLGDDSFEVRESASNRLALIGEPALPLIDKALKSEDAEVRRRAEDLKAQIVAAAEARRKDLLSKETPWRLRPTFHFAAKPDERAGHKIETARIHLTPKDAPASKTLREALGPDWNRLRLVAHGKQVVVLLGSDDRLLDAALANLKDGKPGLAEARALAPFTRQADTGHQLELHASVATWLEWLRADDLRRSKTVGKAFSSAALTVGPDRLRVDLWVPASEVGAILKKQEP